MNKLRSATFCSGVGAPEVAMGDIVDFKYCCEFDKFPSAVLASRFPDIPNIGDMLKRHESDIYNSTEIDLAMAGTPCQGFSVAGLRGGLDSDDRAMLTIEFVRILQEKQPRWFIWENVPGVLSSGGGADFKEIVRAFTSIGYGICWRLLDAQYIGVPQRRRRVFIVGHLGDWRPSYRVLFEFKSLHGNIGKGGEKRKKYTRDTEGNTGDTICNRMRGFGDYVEDNVSSALLARDAKDAKDAKDLVCQSIHGTQDPIVSKELAHCLGRNNGQENAIVSIHENQRAEVTLNDTCGALKTLGGKPGQGYPCVFRYSKSHRQTYIDQRIYNDGTTNTLNTGDGCSNQSTQNFVVPDPEINRDGYVRKLTPLECERLQGFPDNWTQIAYTKYSAGDCPKGHRYRAMGNSMAVPVIRWIGERIVKVDNYLRLQD